MKGVKMIYKDTKKSIPFAKTENGLIKNIL